LAQKKGLQLSNKKVYDVKIPIFGFENIAQIHISPIDNLFSRLYNVNNPDIPVFLLINPHKLRDYDFDIGTEVRTMLKLNPESKTDLSIYSIMIQDNDIPNSTINFIAPIIINEENNTAAQIILDIKRYPEFQVDEKLSSYIGKLPN
jgi:flagellar assembly factor FliW